MNYQQTIEYLFSQLPIYSRIGQAAYKEDLTNTIKLSELLNHPEQNFKSIHIAGTNGKGSTSHLLASILQAKGLKTGLYTSPHLKDFRERIKINGNPINKSYVSSFINKYKDEFESIGLSFFEMTVGLAFKYFSDEKVDIAIIEVGLGGRLDSTNIITPELSIITNISFDHTALLGKTLEKIAAEKAGIFKPGIPIVIGETQKGVRSIFNRQAKRIKSDIHYADKYLTIQAYRKVDKEYLYNKFDILKFNKPYLYAVLCPLSGYYQQKNMLTVIKAVEVLNRSGYEISNEEIKEGFKQVVTNTGLLGRWQTLSQNPLTICDVGHNESGIREVVGQIKDILFNHLHFVFGTVNDKDIDAILQLLPKEATYYFCKADIPRALDAVTLMNKAKDYKLSGQAYKSVKLAFNSAKKAAQHDDLIFIGGSTFVVAEVL